MAQLPPVPQPIGIFQNLIARQTETLVLKENVLSLSGDSFDIKLANGQPILSVKGSVLSLSGRKAVTDMQGNHMFDIRKELLNIHTTFFAEDAQGKKFFQVRSKFQILGSKAYGTFKSVTGKDESLVMKGNFFDTSADIVDESTGAVVARIERKLLSGRDLLFGQQSYAVVVAPGVDMALIAAMCICLDEKRNEK